MAKCEQKESENDALNLDKKSAESTNKKLQCCFGASKLEKEKLKDELESVEKDWKIFELSHKAERKENTIVKENLQKEKEKILQFLTTR